MSKILVGNVFPTSLIRRECSIRPATLDELRGKAMEGVASFWGHSNTLSAASTIVGVDLTPTTERPALTLSSDHLPVLDGQEWNTVWVLSPDYAPGFRPAIGAEVEASQIKGWQVLLVIFQERTK